MPPKVKITKEAIVQAAVEVVRTHGTQSLNARTLAARLQCSTQPIFSNFATMEDLRLAVMEHADKLCREYTQREVESGAYPVYKASGMAYIRFAKEEKELFQLLYMCDRSGKELPIHTTGFQQMVDLVHQNTGLNTSDAQLFHLEVWAYVHGIATMFATGFLDLDWELVSHMLTDAYQGLRKQHSME